MSTTWRMSAELLGMVFLAASYGLAQELPPPATKAEASTSGQSEVPTDKIRLPKGMAVRLFLIEPISIRSEEHTSELQSRGHLVCRLLLEKKNSLAESDEFTLHSENGILGMVPEPPAEQ